MLRCELRSSGTEPQDSPASGAQPSSREPRESVYLEIVRKTGELAGVIVRDPGGVGIEFVSLTGKPIPGRRFLVPLSCSLRGCHREWRITRR